MEQGVRNESPDQTAEPVLAFTAKAVEMIRHAMRLKGVRDGGIRMTVAGGGCKGFQYSLNLEQTAQADDAVVVQDGVKAFLDPPSAQHLQGTRLDYVTNRQGTGFHFFGMESSRTIGCRSTVLLRWCIENNTRTKGLRPVRQATADGHRPGGGDDFCGQPTEHLPSGAAPDEAV